MGWTKRIAKRTVVATGDGFLVVEDASGRLGQAVVMYDENEVQVGTESNPMPTRETLVGATPYNSVGPKSSGVIKNTPGRLKDLTITAADANASTVYLQLFNAVAVPGDTTVPVMSIEVKQGATVGIEWSKAGKLFTTGICWASSTTADEKTGGGQLLVDGEFS